MDISFTPWTSVSPNQTAGTMSDWEDQFEDSLLITNIQPADLGADVYAVYNVKAQPYNATGDGTNDDTTAIQAAIDAAEAAGGGIVFFPNGVYSLSSQLTITKPIQLKGVGMGTDDSDRIAAGVDAVTVLRITAGFSDANVLQFRSATAANFLTGCGIFDIQIDIRLANPVIGVQWSGVCYSQVDRVLIHGGLGSSTCFKIEPGLNSGEQGSSFNEFGLVRLNCGTSATTTCLHIAGETTAGSQGTSCFQNRFRSLDVSHGVGVGIKVTGNCDNNVFGKVYGTGSGYTLQTEDGATSIYPREFHFDYFVGEVDLSANTKHFHFAYWTSEAGGLEINSTATAHFLIQDFAHGDLFQSHRYAMTDELWLPASMWQENGATSAVFASFGGSWSMANTAENLVRMTMPGPYGWSDGTITGIKIHYGAATADAGLVVVFRVRINSAATNVDMTANQYTGGNQSATVPSGTPVNKWHSHTIDLSGDSIAFTRGNMIALDITRMANDSDVTDTATNAVKFLGATLLFESSGPAAGTWEIPVPYTT